LADLRRLDTTETNADPDGAGALTSGYDRDFREPIRVPDGSQIGAPARKERVSILVPCQVVAGEFEALRQLASGDDPSIRFTLAMHFRDLESMSLVDPDGTASLHVGTRLAAICSLAGDVVQTIPDPPGAYLVEARPVGWGLDMRAPKRNLLYCVFTSRERGVA